MAIINRKGYPMSGQTTIYTVRFLDAKKAGADDADLIELVVRQVEPSSFPGLLCLKGLIFDENLAAGSNSAQVAERFLSTTAIHVPYHNILAIEERLLAQPSDDSKPPKLAILPDRDLPHSDDE